MTIPHLTKEKEVIFLVAQSREVNANEFNGALFHSKTLKRIRLHNNNAVYILPLSTLVGPWFVVYNTDYHDKNTDNVIQVEITTYIVEPMKKWGNTFLPI